jgi:hypothetical protein
MDPRIFPIHPPSTALFVKVMGLIFAINCAFFALLALVIYAAIDIDGPVARIAAPVALGSSLLMMLFIFFSVFIWFYFVGSRTSFGLIETHLVIRNSAHGKHFAYDELKIDAARIVDLQAEPQYRPGKKIFAIKAFFFYGGAFHLQNDEKAHVFYTGTPQAVYIPTHKDHALLLGPEDPDGFLQTLQEFAPTTM